MIDRAGRGAGTGDAAASSEAQEPTATEYPLENGNSGPIDSTGAAAVVAAMNSRVVDGCRLRLEIRIGGLSR